MKNHETTAICPACGSRAALTTEWGWVDDDTCTATLACPGCRTESGLACAAAQVSHAPDEDAALAGIDPTAWAHEIAQAIDKREEEGDINATCHRDGTVTFWSVFRQTWICRTDSISDAELAAMGERERERVMRHLGIASE